MSVFLFVAHPCAFTDVIQLRFTIPIKIGFSNLAASFSPSSNLRLCVSQVVIYRIGQ